MAKYSTYYSSLKFMAKWMLSLSIREDRCQHSSVHLEITWHEIYSACRWFTGKWWWGGLDNLDTTFSNDALEILHSAAQYQVKASDTSKPSAWENSEFSLKNFKNLKKAQSIVEERKAKKEEAKLLDTGIRVSACFGAWMILENEAGAEVNTLLI